MKLFDAHCHLQDPEILPDIGKIMVRASGSGVERMACCGTNSGDWKTVLRLPEQFAQVIPMIGIHPWQVPVDWKESFQYLEKLLQENPQAGIGETGLDFQERFENRAVQEACFAAHLDLARELNRSVAVHCVRAWGRLIEILREHPAPRVLLHAFGGAPELIPQLVELNCWFSLCGSVANPQAKRARDAVAAVPADRLLIETDSPDFTPSGCLFPNEPSNLTHVACAVAELRCVPPERLAAITYANSSHLFADS